MIGHPRGFVSMSHGFVTWQGADPRVFSGISQLPPPCQIWHVPGTICHGDVASPKASARLSGYARKAPKGRPHVAPSRLHEDSRIAPHPAGRWPVPDTTTEGETSSS